MGASLDAWRDSGKVGWGDPCELVKTALGIDLVGPLPCTEKGNKYVMTVTDYFTKWSEARAILTKEAIDVAVSCLTALCGMDARTVWSQIKGESFATKTVVSLHVVDTPRYWLHVCFFEHVLNKFRLNMAELTSTRVPPLVIGIKACWWKERTEVDHHWVTSAYHPQTNGLTERFNQTLKSALIQVVNRQQNDWDLHLEKILFGYR